MADFPPSISAQSFTTSAFIIGYLLIDDLNPAEQNSVGNWFMLVGQVLSTNSAQQQVLNNRSQENKDGNHAVNSDERLSAVKQSVSTMSEVLNRYP